MVVTLVYTMHKNKYNSWHFIFIGFPGSLGPGGDIGEPGTSSLIKLLVNCIINMENKKYHTVRTIQKYHTVRTVQKYQTVVND